MCGPHHAAQMSHSPHQPRQPGPKTQEVYITTHIQLKTALLNALPGD